MENKKTATAPQFVYFMLIAIGVTIGTGAYVAYPMVMYLLLGAAFFTYCFFLFKKVYKVNVGSNLALLLYVAFLLINYLRDYGNAITDRLYINFFLGICAYLVIVKVLSLQEDTTKFRYLPLVSLVIIALGLVLEMNGLIGFRDQEDGPESLSEGWLLRPGGFLNPNMSAALSLIWLFIALESKLDNCYWLKSVCIAIGVFIAAITQSRAALLFLFIYSAYKAYEGGIKGIKYYLILIVCGLSLFMFFNQSGMLEDLYNANMVRAQGDSSSEERYLVLQGALTTFAGSPITGSGIRAMYRFFGLGTHDEIIEWLVNFGLAGFLVMLLIFFKFYYVNSFKYLCLCILPTFLFSHNFFETTAFQVALAYAFYLMKRGAQEKTGTLAAWNAPPRAAMEDTATVSNTN